MPIVKAIQLVRRRIEYSEDQFAEIVIWKLDQPVLGSSHLYKYRLAFVANERCILRFDNESGKGDHRHIRDDEFNYKFKSIESLLFDFQDEIRRLNDENRST